LLLSITQSKHNSYIIVHTVDERRLRGFQQDIELPHSLRRLEKMKSKKAKSKSVQKHSEKRSKRRSKMSLKKHSTKSLKDKHMKHLSKDVKSVRGKCLQEQNECDVKSSFVSTPMSTTTHKRKHGFPESHHNKEHNVSHKEDTTVKTPSCHYTPFPTYSPSIFGTTSSPSPQHSSSVSPSPSPSPSPLPVKKPTAKTPKPTCFPTVLLTDMPTKTQDIESPTEVPTTQPSDKATIVSTNLPSYIEAPSTSPTAFFTLPPSTQSMIPKTKTPSALSTNVPTYPPSPLPTKPYSPSLGPSLPPTKAPTLAPPSMIPKTETPTASNTNEPTSPPSFLSTESQSPSPRPSLPLSKVPTAPPSSVLPNTEKPTALNTAVPSYPPTLLYRKTKLPSSRPSLPPTTDAPTAAPSSQEIQLAPSSIPTGKLISHLPSSSPSLSPSNIGKIVAVSPNGTLPFCNASVGLTNGAILSVSTNLSNIDIQPPFIGSASITRGTPQRAFLHMTYIIDVSGSTAGVCDSTRSVLECEKDALLNLNQQLIQTSSGVSVGLVAFSSEAVAVDLNATAPGKQLLTTPGNPEVVDAITAQRAYGNTSFRRAMQLAAEIVREAKKNPSITRALVVFLSDGNENTVSDLSTQIANLTSLGASVYSFAVGPDSRCKDNLVRIANETGGECNEVLDAVNLDSVVPETVFRDLSLTAVKATLNGTNISTSSTPVIPELGLPPQQTPVKVYAEDVSVQQQGQVHELCLTAYAGDESVSCCIDYQLVKQYSD
jgi:hypothetical protein